MVVKVVFFGDFGGKNPSCFVTGRPSMIFAYIKMVVFIYKNLYGFLNGELLNNR